MKTYLMAKVKIPYILTYIVVNVDEPSKEQEEILSENGVIFTEYNDEVIFEAFTSWDQYIDRMYQDLIELEHSTSTSERNKDILQILNNHFLCRVFTVEHKICVFFKQGEKSFLLTRNAQVIPFELNEENLTKIKLIIKKPPGWSNLMNPEIYGNALFKR